MNATSSASPPGAVAAPPRRRTRAALPAGWPGRLGLLALIGAAAGGIALRAAWMYAQRPGLLGSRDTGIYFQSVAALARDPMSDPLRPAGYAWFLRGMGALHRELTFAVGVQHALGFVAGALLLGVLRRAGAPLLLAVVPAAVLWLGGGTLLLEHAVISEAWFTFLVVAALWAAARCADPTARRLGWAGVAGLALAAATATRQVGLLLIPVVGLWLLVGSGGPRRARLARAAAAVGVSGALVLAYLGVHAHRHGAFAFTSTGNWNAYGRVAPWVDCTRFTPPAGTRGLCPDPAPAQRRGTQWWIFDPASPVNVTFGFSNVFPDPRAGRLIGRFARAAVLGQPGDYLGQVAGELRFFVRPRAVSDVGAGAQPAELAYSLDYDQARAASLYFLAPAFHPGVEARRPVWLGRMLKWGAVGHLLGWPTVLALALAVLGPLAGRGPARRLAPLFLGAALVLGLVPVLTVVWDYRFVVPAYGPLFAAGALGAWALAERVRPERAARSGR